MIGELPPNVLEAMLESIPIEFSILDNNDRVLVWNKHETRLFKRPKAVIGKNVRNCHPKKVWIKLKKLFKK